jgi:hypothetical protein
VPLPLPFPFPEIIPPTTYGPLLECLAVSSMANRPVSKLSGDTPTVTATVCVSAFVGSVLDAAVIVTPPPIGTALGAVNVVGAALAVWAGEKVPQAPGLPQLTVQSTPAFAASLVSVATRTAVWFCAMELLATGWLILTEIGATIVTRVVALSREGPPVAAAVATMVTTGLGVGFGAGTVGGAVKVAGTPLAVCEGETEPQGELEQFTAQLIPELLVSFEIVATTVAVPLIGIVLGGT